MTGEKVRRRQFLKPIAMVAATIGFSYILFSTVMGSPRNVLFNGKTDETLVTDSSLHILPISFRNDGFSHYYGIMPPMNRQILESELIAPLAGSDVQIMEWGLGPGSVFCYDTKVGEMFGAGLTDSLWGKMRKGDRYVYENLKSLKDAGVDPLQVAVEYGHSLGLKVFARMEMQHEYGPVDSWEWIGFVGKLNKDHPEYRMPGKVYLDFKYQAVRDFKLAIFREAAERGFDGISADFSVYPRYFQEPDKYRNLMTQFIRDIRRMLDDVGRAQGRKIEFMIRVPCYDSYQRGLDWKTGMKEGLFDYIVPGSPVKHFFLDPREFINYRNTIGSNCKVFGCIWQALGLIDTDPTPDGKQLYSKPKTREMFFSQALLYNRVGCDGLQFAFADISQWEPYMAGLGTPEQIEFADKQYMVDVISYMPMIFDVGSSKNEDRKDVKLHIADDIAKAFQKNLQPRANIILYCRSFQPGEILKVSVNQHPFIEINTDLPEQPHADSIITTADIHSRSWTKAKGQESFINVPDWWQRGKKTITVNAEQFMLGENTLTFEYLHSNDLTKNKPSLEITWIDVTFTYK